jgi:Polymerase beta, Nucleotidyltransferase
MNERRAALAAICRRFDIQILYAFGSRAREVLAWLDDPAAQLPAGPSDVDLGAKPPRGSTLPVLDKVRLAQAFEDLLGVSRVDLVLLPDADPFLAVNIIRGERLFADDETLADEYDLYILRRAGDLAPFERERMDSVLGKRH